MDIDDADLDRARRGCTRSITWHGDRAPASQLAELPEDIAPDRYGEGGVVDELEAEVAELLGAEAAAFFVSGTMAQQIALRIHADRRGRRTIAYHPACHLEQHEGRAHERLHGLVSRPVGSLTELITLADLRAVPEPLAALLLELPQRDLGGALPAWEDLVAQTEWAVDTGAATHLDGARVWQCPTAYDQPLQEIAGLFDSTYVSFYKDLGAMAGSALVGDADLIAQAKEWRHRHGGTLFAMWPYAASALAALRLRLPRMPLYAEQAAAIAVALEDVDGVRVVPDPPQTSMLHLHLRTTEVELRRAVLDLAVEERLWTWRASAPSGHPDWRTVELTVGDATLELEPAEIADAVGRLVRRD